MERTIGKLKANIRSKSKVAENAVNVLKDHFSKTYRAWNRYDEENDGAIGLELPQSILEELNPDANATAFFKRINEGLVEDSNVRIINEYSKLKSGQKLKSQRAKTFSVVVNKIEDERHTGNFTIATIKKMFRFKGEDWCVVISERQLDYIEEYNYLHFYSIVNMKYVVAYAIHMPSSMDLNKIYIRWKK